MVSEQFELTRTWGKSGRSPALTRNGRSSANAVDEPEYLRRANYPLVAVDCVVGSRRQRTRQPLSGLGVEPTA